MLGKVAAIRKTEISEAAGTVILLWLWEEEEVEDDDDDGSGRLRRQQGSRIVAVPYEIPNTPITPTKTDQNSPNESRLTELAMVLKIKGIVNT